MPVHPNPAVRETLLPVLDGLSNVLTVEPLNYGAFSRILRRSTVVLTDSGGVQEEAPSLGKPVLVMRDTTERPEAVAAGTARLVGTNADRIVDQVGSLLSSEQAYKKMANAVNPYGDGHAARRTVDAIAHQCGLGPRPQPWRPESPSRGGRTRQLKSSQLRRTRAEAMLMRQARTARFARNETPWIVAVQGPNRTRAITEVSVGRHRRLRGRRGLEASMRVARPIAGVPVIHTPLAINSSNAEDWRAAVLPAIGRGYATVVVGLSDTDLCGSVAFSELERRHRHACAEGAPAATGRPRRGRAGSSCRG